MYNVLTMNLYVEKLIGIMETVKPESSSPSSSKEFSCQIQDKVEERPSSPTDCAICLEQLTDKSFTNSCLHMFCFHCLLAWSKVKIKFRQLCNVRYNGFMNYLFTDQARMSIM